MTAKKRLSVWLAAILVALTVIPVHTETVLAGSSIPASQVFQYQNIERGVTVVPNGNVYTIIEGGTLRVFTGSGSGVFSVKLPSEYCGNLCSASDGTVFAHTYSNGDIYVFSPGSNAYKSLKAGSGCDFLATDSNGYLYNINSEGKAPDTGKKATVIYRAKIADVKALPANSTIQWEETFQPNYTPPADSGICYPAGLAVDSAGNAYIADKGSYNGYDSSVSGIYKYNLYTGKITALRFLGDDNVAKMTWIHSVACDDYGNVAVVGRNSNMIAVFRNGSTSADAMISVPGYCDDISADGKGNFFYGVEKNGTTSINGIYKISTDSVGVSDLTLSEASKTIEAGSSFNLTAVVSPEDATNKTVLFGSSDEAIVSVTAEGVVTALKEGSAVITAKTAQGGLSRQCSVTVTKKEEPASGEGSGSSGSSGSGGEQGSGTIVDKKASTPAAPVITVEKAAEGSQAAVPAGTIKILSAKNKTVVFVKAKNAKSIIVPDIVKINGKTYKVSQINAGAFTARKIRTVTIGKNVKVIKKKAFSKSKATKLIVKSKLLKKAKVKGSLTGSGIKTVQIKVGSKKVNKQYVKKYKKIFTKANAGKKVTVK